MIDSGGFRPNVGIVLANNAGQVLWARRVGGRDNWQFPQGGIHEGEQPEEALYRELREEVGLNPEDVTIKACTKSWLNYRLPERLIRRRNIAPENEGRVCIGQKQKWFLLEMLAGDDAISFEHSDEPPEFDHWQWVSYWYPVDKVVSFKQGVYRKALFELAPTHHLLHLKQEQHAC